MHKLLSVSLLKILMKKINVVIKLVLCVVLLNSCIKESEQIVPKTETDKIVSDII